MIGSLFRRKRSMIRDDSPIEMRLGNIVEWRRPSDWKLHREDGPAVITHFGSARKTAVHTETYYRNGVPHRTDGPTAVYYDGGGAVYDEKFYVLGYRINRLSNVGEELRHADQERLLTAAGDAYRDLVSEGVHAESVIAALMGGVVSVEGIRQVDAGAPVEWVRAYEGSDAR